MKINDGRIKPKREATFGKKPYAGKDRNRKGSKLKTNRLKPVYSAKNKSLISDEDREYLEWLQSSAYPCLVCGGFNGIEWHHVKEFSFNKKNHERLIPLCGVEHHRLGQILSAHGTPKKWRETYSIQMQNEAADKIYQDYLDSNQGL